MTVAEEQNKVDNPSDLQSETIDLENQIDGETDETEVPTEESSAFALKMINSVKAMNSGELSHYEMVNSFSLAGELKCLFMFIQGLPHRPILPMYPEAPFLISIGQLCKERCEFKWTRGGEPTIILFEKNSDNVVKSIVLDVRCNVPYCYPAEQTSSNESRECESASLGPSPSGANEDEAADDEDSDTEPLVAQPFPGPMRPDAPAVGTDDSVAQTRQKKRTKKDQLKTKTKKILI